MEVLGYIGCFVIGASVPTWLLIRQTTRTDHLFNVILKREKLPTLAQPFELQAVKSSEPKVDNHRDRHSRPTAIDLVMNKALIDDTQESKAA